MERVYTAPKLQLKDVFSNTLIGSVTMNIYLHQSIEDDGKGDWTLVPLSHTVPSRIYIFRGD